nr:EOG090X0AW0 [Sida crystallina]
MLLRQYRIFYQNVPLASQFSSTIRLSNNSSIDLAYSRDPGELFFNDEVQTLLTRLTGCSYEKVFKPRKLGTTLKAPKYELLTQEEVDTLMTEVEQKAKEKLKMPPLLSERKPIDNILSHNPELQGFDTAKYVFTDITYGVSNRKRRVVVRDPNGDLREATWEERSKVSQIYFPMPGKQIQMPKMFEERHLQNCLDREEYEFILDRACTQFEPDDPDYIRVTRKTYNTVDEKGHYSVLRSTRHFGPMVLHLVLIKRLDDLMCYFITNEDINAAADLVRLVKRVRPDSASHDNQINELQLVENYIRQDALKKPALELAWETFLEIERQRNIPTTPEQDSRPNTATSDNLSTTSDQNGDDGGSVLEAEIGDLKSPDDPNALSPKRKPNKGINHFSATANAFIIYDAYEQDQLQVVPKSSTATQSIGKNVITGTASGEVAAALFLPPSSETAMLGPAASSRLNKAAHVIERMLNQNTFDDVAQGNNMSSEGGLVNIFSLKSPAMPEQSARFPAGVSSVDFHHEYWQLLAVGLHDGHIVVLDLAVKTRVDDEIVVHMHTNRTSILRGKRTVPITQVQL